MADSPRPRNTSRPGPRANAQEWRDAKARVVEKIDMRVAYESMRVQFIGSESNGRLACYAIDRTSERTPGSAGVTMTGKFRGYYSDYAHDRLNLSLFDFAMQFGGHTDYGATLRHFAQMAGVILPVGDYKHKQPLRDKSPKPPPKIKRETKYENIGGNIRHFHKRALRFGDAEMGLPSMIDLWASSLGLHRDSIIHQSWGLPGPDALREYRLDDAGMNALCPECQIIDGRPVIMSADRRGTGDLKMAMDNRPRGIIPPLGWIGRARKTGYLFIAEGHTDTAALDTMGLGGIGIPSAGVGGNMVADLVGPLLASGQLPAKTIIVCLIDRDDGAGETGMRKISHILAGRLRRPIYRRTVPSIEVRHEGYPSWSRWLHPKDSREWLKGVCDRPDLAPERERRELGRRFAEEVFVEDHGHDTNYFTSNRRAIASFSSSDATQPVDTAEFDQKFDGQRARLGVCPSNPVVSFR